MLVRHAFLADSANISQQGKLNVLGAFNVIGATTFPALHPSLCYVAIIQFDADDVGVERVIELHYVDADGASQAAPLLAKLRIDSIPQPGQPNTHEMIVQVTPMQIAAPGSYCVDFWSAGRRYHSVEFYAVVATG